MFGMIERGEKLRFSLEARPPFGCFGECAQHLDSDVSMELRIGGPVHDPHAPGAELFGDAIVVQRFANHRGRLMGSDLRMFPTAESTGEIRQGWYGSARTQLLGKN